MAVFLVAE